MSSASDLSTAHPAGHTIVELLDERSAPLLAQPFYAGGDPGPIVTSLAHVPELLEVALPFVGEALGASAIDFRTKELVILRTSAVLRCRYCVETHAPIAHDAALTPAEIEALCLPEEDHLDEAFPDPADRALIAWTDTVALGRGTPPPEAVRAIRAQAGDADLVELTMLVAATLMLNRYASSLGLPTSASSLETIALHGLATHIGGAA